jgi:zinc transporter ZupT
LSLIYYKAIAALIIFVSSVVAVIYPLKAHFSSRQREPLELGEAFASGIFLGVAFFHMLPVSIASFQRLWPTTHYPIAEFICIIGFISLLFLERLSLITTNHHPRASIPYILTLILVIHSLIEGTALGVNTTFTEAFMIFIAIIAHKGSASFALCVTLMRHKIALRALFSIIFFFSLITPLGIFLGTLLNTIDYGKNGQLTEAIFNAFATGSFFYMSTLHHVQFHQRATEEGHGLLEFLFLVIGLSIMGLVALWI